MTVAAMAYVWQTPLNGSQKLMLLAIADRCDDEGVCFPGVEYLATKCGINKRAAQKLIQKLVDIGEIFVEIQSGMKTGSGNTNRYYMKKFREMLGLSSPDNAARGEQMDIPQESEGVSKNTSLESEGVSKRTSHGVSKRTSNPKENPKEKEITTITDGKVISMPIADSQKSAKKPRSAKQAENDGLVEALGKALGVMAVDGDYGIYARNAQKLVKAGIPPDEFSRYVKRLRLKARPGYEINVRTIVAGGSMSEYVAARNEHQRKQAAQSTPKPVEDTYGIDLMLSWLEESKPA